MSFSKMNTSWNQIAFQKIKAVHGTALKMT